MENCRIDKRLLGEVRKIMEDSKEMKNWMEFLKATEPNLYYWILRETDAVINRTGDTYEEDNLYVVSWKPDIVNAVKDVFLSSWIILKKAEEQHLNHIIMTPEIEFENWLKGKLPSRYYNFDIADFDKDDCRCIAKTAHIARINVYKTRIQRQKKQLELFRKIKEKADNSERKQQNLQ